MKNISRIKLNLIKEKLYTETLVNELYENIAYYGERDTEIKTLMEFAIREEKSNSIIEDIVTDLKLAPKFIFSFGTGIGAFYEPIDLLLSGSGFQMSEYQVYLLIITSIALLLNESDASTLIQKVKDEGIYSALSSVKKYISSTKNLINTVAKNVLGTVYSLSDVLGFTALLAPTTNLMSDIINDYGLNINTFESMMKGLVLASAAYGIKSIINRIKNKLG